MPDLNYLAILASAGAAFILSAVYYALLGGQLARLHEAYADADARPGLPTLVVEIVRNLLVAVVLAVLAAGLDLTAWPGAIVLALGLWLGFPVVLLAGSVFHERYQARLAAIHAGD